MPEIPKGPSFFTDVADWGLEQIMCLLREVTLNNKDGDLVLKKLWNNYLKYFAEGKSYPFEAPLNDQPELETTEIVLHGTVLEIHSSWCALAAVVNFIIPPYDPEGGTITGYGYSAATFLAKWADTISRNFRGVKVITNDQHGKTRTELKRVQFTPPFFTFTWKSPIDSGDWNGYVAVVSTGKCVNLPSSPLTSALNEKLVAARWNQVVTSSNFSGISAENCPFPRDSFLIKPPCEPERVGIEIGRAPKDSVKQKTLELFKLKLVRPASKVYHMGGCAELWGFLVMQNHFRDGEGGHFNSITIDVKWAHCTKLIGYNQMTVDCTKCPDGSGYWKFNTGAHCKNGRKHKILTPKPGCLGCLFLASAIEAKKGAVWKQDSEGITLRPYETPRDSGSTRTLQDIEVQEQSTPSDQPV
ncbi:hypothetical protein P167DRAFT_543364 [Morchella conica CCBAS932]|uniref:Uncharacterized protein n=1 Tax=Morchella conica CCBAS932 TaxID=1392247 RepID=A0A3N4KZY2_9PEZI|nr:hypothetical protein P167DRAFT_543364 [Morchella conica CCBAS932]